MVMSRSELKPQKRVFLTFRLLLNIVLAMPFIFILAFLLKGFFGVPVLLSLVAGVALLVFRWWSLAAQYAKERYVFGADRVVRFGGGIFHDTQTELRLKNITHVKMRLPWLENILFGTGTVAVQSAGSGGVEVALRNVKDPEMAYGAMKEMMQRAGFGLSEQKPVCESQPDTVAVLFEVVSQAAAFLAGTVAVVLSAIPGLAALWFFASDAADPVLVRAGIILLAVLAAVAFLGLCVRLVLRYHDLKLRTYRLFHDTVRYSEGFLTTEHAFMPVENISDAETSQTMVSRILEVSDVRISCQGSGQEILFKHMRDGEVFAGLVDKQVAGFRARHRKSRPAAKAAMKERPPADDRFSAEYRMHLPRILSGTVALVLLLLVLAAAGVFVRGGIGAFLAANAFLIAIVLIVYTLSPVMRALFTRYSVEAAGVRERYRFIRTRDVEYTPEKMTGIKVTANPLDMMFGTASMHFWSIGSSSDLVFRSVKGLSVEEIAKKIGAYPSRSIETWRSSFGGLAMVQANLPLLLAIAAVVVAAFPFSRIASAAIMAGAVVVAFCCWIYLRLPYGRTEMRFYRSHMEFQEGFFWRSTYYIPYDGIKGITTLRYPLSRKGYLSVDVAGEVVMRSDKSRWVRSNKFTAHYFADPSGKHDAFDAVLRTNDGTMVEHPLGSGESLRERESVANVLLPVSIFAVAVFFAVIVPLKLAGIAAGIPAAAVAIAIVGLPVLFVKARSYALDEDRALAYKGLLRKRKRSVVYPKIDHLNLKRDVLNKIFGNGSVHIYTAGTTASFGAELAIRNVHEFARFHDELKSRYKD